MADVDETDDACGRDILARLVSTAGDLREGENREVVIEWAVVRLAATSNLVVVQEPDYRRNPNEFIPSMATTARLFCKQRNILEQLGLSGEPVEASQYARVSTAAFGAVSVLGRRERDPENAFTGWQIESTDPSANDAFGMYTVREIAAKRLIWMAPLALPPGWAFRFVGNTLMDTVSPTGDTHTPLLSIDL